MRNLRIVFMGTPDFAVPTLKALLDHDYNVVGVITAPDKPSGRGLKLNHSPVKEFALLNNIPVLQPTNLKSEQFLEELRGLEANLQIVVAFRMLPEVVFGMPKFGSFNIHGSLLPNYRGAAPINWALINGETETGVTSFFLNKQIDTGDIILKQKVSIDENDDFGSLYEKLKHEGAKLALKTVRAIELGDCPTYEQETVPELKHAPKIFTADCKINMEQSVKGIRNFIRGLSPIPGAWTLLDGKVLKIYKADAVEGINYDLQPGEYKTDGKTYLHFQAEDGIIDVLELQLEGKKRMNSGEFIRGYNFMAGK